MDGQDGQHVEGSRAKLKQRGKSAWEPLKTQRFPRAGANQTNKLSISFPPGCAGLCAIVRGVLSSGCRAKVGQ
jgi:hypothetical protein